MDYSEWFDPSAKQIATDTSGALYVLSTCGASGSTNSCVTKVSADGKTVVWRNQLGFAASAMAVDPGGGVYVLTNGPTSLVVAKLDDSGTGLLWQTAAGFTVPNGTGWPPVLAADSKGRAYVAGTYDLGVPAADVVRLKADGSGVDYTAQVKGDVSAIAIDGSGAAYVAGMLPSGAFGFALVARIAPDGSAGFYSKLVPVLSAPQLAVDPSGNTALYAFTGGAWLLDRLDGTGSLTSSASVGTAPSVSVNSRLAMDGAGNTYVVGAADQLFPAKNSVATCGSAPAVVRWLGVYGPDGTLLQSTYVPGAASTNFTAGQLIAVSSAGHVFVVAAADATFAPSQAGPFSPGTAGSPNALIHLSPNPQARTFPLACIGNSASWQMSPVAPGTLMTLFGSNLGPPVGVQPKAAMDTPFPTQTAGVQVTFDGTPAPLLWVQDAQINAVAPWSLAAGKNTKVCVINNGVSTNCLTWPVADASPGVFTTDGLHAAAVNEDGTINSPDNPAPPGSVVAVYATGLGPIAPIQSDGAVVNLPLPTNVLPVTAQATTPPIFFQPPQFIDLEVTYAGPAPYEVAGVSQVNVRVLSSVAGVGIRLFVPGAGTDAFEIYVARQ